MRGTCASLPPSFLFSCCFLQKSCQTRKHSSRMRTARLLTVSQGVCIPACNGADPPRGQTDTCKNIIKREAPLGLSSSFRKSWIHHCCPQIITDPRRYLSSESLSGGLCTVGSLYSGVSVQWGLCTVGSLYSGVSVQWGLCPGSSTIL